MALPVGGACQQGQPLPTGNLHPMPAPNACSYPSLQVTVASVEDDLTVTCSRKVRLVADKSIQECAGDNFDLIALPVSQGVCVRVEVVRLQGGAR